MRTKFLLGVLTISVGINSAFAQPAAKESPKSSINTTFKFGEVDPESKKETLRRIFYDDGTNIYAVATKDAAKVGYVSPKIKPVIIKYNDKLDPVTRLEIEPNEGNETYIGAYQLKGDMFFLLTRFDKTSKKLGIIVKKLTSDLKQDGGDITLYSIEEAGYKDAEIKVEFSPKMEKCCMVLIPEQEKSANKEAIAVVFDNNFSLIYKKKLAYAKQSNLVKIMNLALTEHGDIFVLSKMYDTKDEEETKTKTPAYTYTLKKHTAENETECKIPATDKFIYSTALMTDKSDNIRLSMSYENRYFGGIVGVRYNKFNSQNCSEIEHADFNFDKTVIERMNLISESNDKSNQNFLTKMAMPKFDPEAIGVFYSISILESPEDGSTYLTLQNDAYKGATTGGSELYQPNNTYLIKMNTAIQANTFFSYGVVVVKIASSQVKWQRAIPKIQFFNIDPEYLFNVPVFTKNKFCILYNDEKENEHYNIETSKVPPKKFNDIKAVYLMMVEIDENGNMIRSSVTNTTKLATNINTQVARQTASDRIVLPGFMMNSMGDNKQTRMGVAKIE